MQKIVFFVGIILFPFFTNAQSNALSDLGFALATCDGLYLTCIKSSTELNRCVIERLECIKHEIKMQAYYKMDKILTERDNRNIKRREEMKIKKIKYEAYVEKEYLKKIKRMHPTSKFLWLQHLRGWRKEGKFGVG